MLVQFDQFLQNLTRCGLVAEQAVSDAWESLATDRREDARALAKALICSGHLTKYQAKALLRGRIRSLTVRDYDVLDLIGKGGMGQVYKARHRRLDRVVALKVIRRDFAENPELVKRFGREMRAVARLSHPNIVHAYDAGQHRGRLFLAMEFIQGTDLRALLKSGGAVPPGQAVDFVIQAARGLEYAHAQGVVHRDVKPANLMLDRGGTLKILDFGLARFEQRGAATSNITQTGDIIGSIDVMAPEQMSNTRTVDHRSDIYSLGCVLYLLLTGNPIFAGASPMTRLAGHMHGEIPSLRLSLPGAPESLDRVLQRMVAKDPDDRPQSMTEVLRDLTRMGSSDEVLPSIPPPQSADTQALTGTELADTSRNGDRVATSAESADTHKWTRPQTSNADMRTPASWHPFRNAATWGVLCLVLIALGLMFWKSQNSSSEADADNRDAGLAADHSHPEYHVDRTVVVPAPEATTWTADTRLRVFILAGQFNMAGRGFVGDLEHLAQERMHQGTFGHLMTTNGAWVERGDVWIYSIVDNAVRSGRLTVGFGEEPDRFGPELGFGQVVGDSIREPVLIIKVAEESLSLAVEGRPPGSGTDAGSFYRVLVNQVDDVLDSLPAMFPAHAGRRAVITGFVWFQGWNDSLNPVWVEEYQANLENLIRDLRTEWGDAELPVVIGEFGPHGKIGPDPSLALAQAAGIRAAQRAVAESSGFRDSVACVETASYVRGGPGARSQYGENAETFYLIGEAFGDAMLELVNDIPAE